MRRDWNYERYRTRDRLLEYDFNIMPPRPHSAGLPMIYPWENIDLSILSKQIYQLAIDHGFTDSEEIFWEHFGTGGGTGTIVTGTLETFPIPGEDDTLYLDLDTDNLYYFKTTTSTISPEAAAYAGVEIVGTSEDNVYTYLYIPVRALLIENTILNCGDSDDENLPHYVSPDTYDGPYVAVPAAWEDTILETSGKTLFDDINVKKIPLYETSNDNGTTVYIGTGG